VVVEGVAGVVVRVVLGGAAPGGAPLAAAVARGDRDEPPAGGAPTGAMRLAAAIVRADRDERPLADSPPGGGWLDAAVAPLAAYLRGEVAVLAGVAWRLAGGTPFQRAVWQGLAAIPAGTTWRYGELAAHLGRPAAARAVGQALSSNPLPVLLPCHRVVGAASLGGFSGGRGWKRYLLGLEKVAIG